MTSDNTQAKHSNLIPYRPGQSGNPAGRPKGSKNKLAETFLQDTLTEWETHGAAAIKDMREKNPGDFVKMVASLVPKEMTLNLNNEIEMTDDELLARIRGLARQLAPFVGGIGDAGGGTEAPASAQLTSRVH